MYNHLDTSLNVSMRLLAERLKGTLNMDSDVLRARFETELDRRILSEHKYLPLPAS